MTAIVAVFNDGDTTESHYLYDGGTLLAIFDEDDDVDQMYINGAGGALAVYQNNLSSKRYYFIKDQIGNTRVMSDNGSQPTSLSFMKACSRMGICQAITI